MELITFLRSQDTPLNVRLLDIAKAFPSTPHRMISVAMQALGTPPPPPTITHRQHMGVFVGGGGGVIPIQSRHFLNFCIFSQKCRSTGAVRYTFLKSLSNGVSERYGSWGG